jgi:intein-encoded DNA endonuclease-like protein
MAINWQAETRSNANKVKILAASNSKTSIYLNDQNIHKFGTNRCSEIKAKIGDDGQPWEATYNNYLDTL